MVELRDLREALDTAQWPANRDAQWHRAQDVIRAAARRFLALTETGRRVHSSRILDAADNLEVGEYIVIPADYLTDDIR